MRLVTDYTKLNKFVHRPIHPFLSTRDILQSIPHGQKFLAKLDAVHGYFQLALDEESSYLTTFLLPKGRFRYLRAPTDTSRLNGIGFALVQFDPKTVEEDNV